MSILGEVACELTSAVLPRRRVDGRESPEAYANAQYRWAAATLALHDQHVRLAGARLLDAGCGLGGKSVYYAEHGCSQVVGLDADPHYIEHATSFARSRGARNVHFVNGSLHALPFASNTFDIVMMNDVLEHLPNGRVDATLRECLRVLVPDGRLCIDFSPWTSHDAAHLYDFIHVPWCQVLFSEDTLLRVAERKAARRTHGSASALQIYKELNRMRIEDFDALVSTLDATVVSRRRKMIRDLAVLERVPGLRDYLTSRMVAVLSKRATSANDPSSPSSASRPDRP